MKLLVTGPQGSGKSTQAVLLAQDLGVPYIQLGQILRDMTLIEDSKTVKFIKDILAKGELLPAQLVAEIMNKRLSQVDCRRGFVLDGYPRKEGDIKNFKQKLDWVVYLKISDQEAIKRLLARGRSDDTQELIEERLKNYHQETKPILRTFEKQGILAEIDGERPIDEIHKDVVKRLKTHEVH